jgi:hypothetical protein
MVTRKALRLETVNILKLLNTVVYVINIEDFFSCFKEEALHVYYKINLLDTVLLNNQCLFKKSLKISK